MNPARHKQLVGYRLRSAIKAVGIIPTQVGRDLNVTPQKLGNWLRGDNYPDEWFIYRFCNRYGITADWIYRGIVTGVPQAMAGALFAAAAAEPAVSQAPAGLVRETP